MFPFLAETMRAVSSEIHMASREDSVHTYTTHSLGLAAYQNSIYVLQVERSGAGRAGD